MLLEHKLVLELDWRGFITHVSCRYPLSPFIWQVFVSSTDLLRAV